MPHFSFKYLNVLHQSEDYRSNLTTEENKIWVVK